YGAGIIRRIDDRPPFVRDAEPSAKIHMLQHEPVVPELDREGCEHGGRAPERLERGDLRADVNVHADKLQALRLAACAVDLASLLERHAELVRLQSGGNV